MGGDVNVPHESFELVSVVLRYGDGDLSGLIGMEIGMEIPDGFRAKWYSS